MHGDREAVLSAVQLDWSALEYACEEMREEIRMHIQGDAHRELLCKDTCTVLHWFCRSVSTY